MAQDDIDKLAKEYAEKCNKMFSDRISPIETWKQVCEREFKQCVEFLLRDHLIVEKSKVMEDKAELDKLAREGYIGNSIAKESYYKGRIMELKILFPEIFNPGKK